MTDPSTTKEYRTDMAVRAVIAAIDDLAELRYLDLPNQDALAIVDAHERLGSFLQGYKIQRAA